MTKNKIIFYFTSLVGTLIMLLGIWFGAEAHLNSKFEDGWIINQDASWKDYYAEKNDPSQLFVNNAMSIYEYDSLLGWDVIPNHVMYDFCGDKTFTSSPLGIRNTLYNEDSIRQTILFIGDSFVEGCEVSDQNTLPSQVAKQLDSTLITNAGIGGYGFGQIFLKLQEMVEINKPDVVVLGVALTDIYRVSLGFRDYYKPFYTIENNELVLHADHIVPPTLFWANYKKSSSIIQLIKQKRDELFFYKKVDLSAKIIVEMENYCKQKGLSFIAINIPSPADFSSQEIFKKQKELFYALSNSSGLYASFDPSDYLMKNSDHLLKQEGHWDSTGNYYLAKYFIDSIYSSPTFPLQ